MTEPDEVRDLKDVTKSKAQLEHEEDILLQRVAAVQQDFNASDEEKQEQEGEGKSLKAKEAEENEPTETERANTKIWWNRKQPHQEKKYGMSMPPTRRRPC